MDIIIEYNLFLGNYKSASELENLKSLGITHILVKNILNIILFKVVGYEL